MYHPTRGGNRGGTDQFTWDTVKTDKHRENYLGHSVMAPVGRWQKGKDLSWYSKERKNDVPGQSMKSQDMNSIKEAEEQAMLIALGYKPAEVESQTLSKEEVVEALKRNTENRELSNVERIEGVGIESGRASMMTLNKNKQSEKDGVVFETELRNTQPARSASPREESHKSAKRKSSKKHKKEKKKHKKKRVEPSDSSDLSGNEDSSLRRQHKVANPHLKNCRLKEPIESDNKKLSRRYDYSSSECEYVSKHKHTESHQRKLKKQERKSKDFSKKSRTKNSDWKHNQKRRNCDSHECNSRHEPATKKKRHDTSSESETDRVHMAQKKHHKH